MLTRQIEEMSLSAWPALRTVHYDGWVLRFADGYTRRANSVNPLEPSTLDLHDKIRYCEQIYFSAGQDVVFKLTPITQPAELDRVLADRGYTREALTSVQRLRLADLDPPDSDAVTLEADLSTAWLERFAVLSKVNERYIEAMARLLGSIVPVHRFATLCQESEAVAQGLAVLEGNHVGLFDIATVGHARNRGFGTRLVCHLLNWGKTNGAHHAYLQVMQDNAPALHLYAKLGFREIYPYWYRIKRWRP